MRALLNWVLIFTLIAQSSPSYAQGNLSALKMDYSTLTVVNAEYTDENYDPEDNYVNYESYFADNNRKIDAFEAARATVKKIEQILNVDNVDDTIKLLHKGNAKGLTRIFKNYIAELFVRQLASARLAGNGFFKAANKEQVQLLLTLGKITKLLEMRLDEQRNENPDIDVEVMKILLIDSAKFTHENLGLLSRGQRERIQLQTQNLEKQLMSTAEFKSVVNGARIFSDIERNLYTYAAVSAFSFSSYIWNLKPISDFMGITEPNGLSAVILLFTILTLTAITSYASVKSIAAATYKYSLFSNNSRIIKTALQSCEGLLRRGPK